MTRRPSFNADAFATIKREIDANDRRSTLSEELMKPEESLALPPSRIAAIIDDLDIEGLPTPMELEAIAASPRSPNEAPAHRKLLSRPADLQLSKPGRAKRALKSEVHELQEMVDRMQAQVTGAASEIQELTRLVGQLVAKKQRDEAAAAVRQEQLEDEQEMERCLAMGDAVPTQLDVAMLEQQLLMDQQARFDEEESMRRADVAQAADADFPSMATFPMCAVKQCAGGGRRL